MTSEEEKNKELARRFMEARVKGDMDAVDEMMAPDYVGHTRVLPGQQPGREGAIRAMAQYSAAFSNARVLVEDQIAGSDKVVSRFVVHVTHDRGELMCIAPSGREFTNTAILIHRMEDGKVAEEWREGGALLQLSQARLEQEIREREQVEQEMRVARRIQQASLPNEVPELEAWQISPHYRPAREVGGDFYDFHLLSDGRVGFVVGDATGKGVPAALLMATTCGMLRAVAQALDSCSPGEVLERVDEALSPNIPANMFVTCFYAVLDPETGSLSYANAGHDLPYLRHQGEGTDELRAAGMPLGLMPGIGYEEKEIVLEEGESVLFYSDGLVEAHDAHREMFGFPRLRRLVGEHDGADGSLVDRLLQELSGFVGDGWEQEDDITLVTLQRLAVT